MAAQLFNRLGQLGLGLAVAGGVVQSALYNVDGGHRAVIFDRFAGVKQGVVGEGTHFMIPWVQRPIVFDIRARPKNVPTITGSKDLQNVNITLRVLFRPRPDALPGIYTTLGVDYDDRVLPSITNEVLKAIVAQFDAGELITQREIVSSRIDAVRTNSPLFWLTYYRLGVDEACRAVWPDLGRHFDHALDLRARVHAGRRAEAGGAARGRESAIPRRNGRAAEACRRHIGRGRHGGRRLAGQGLWKGRRGFGRAAEDRDCRRDLL